MHNLNISFLWVYALIFVVIISRIGGPKVQAIALVHLLAIVLIFLAKMTVLLWLFI